jgi:pectate lyase
MPLAFVCSSALVMDVTNEAEYSKNVWIDHVDVSSDRSHDKDYYDGLIDVRLPYLSSEIAN